MLAALCGVADEMNCVERRWYISLTQFTNQQFHRKRQSCTIAFVNGTELYLCPVCNVLSRGGNAEGPLAIYLYPILASLGTMSRARQINSINVWMIITRVVNVPN